MGLTCIAYEVAWIIDPVGLYGGTKIDKNEQKLNRISGFSKHPKTQTVANAGGGGRI